MQHNCVLLLAFTTTCQHQQLTADLKPKGSTEWELSNQQRAVECRSELGVVDLVKLLLYHCDLPGSVVPKGCI